MSVTKTGWIIAAAAAAAFAAGCAGQGQGHGDNMGASCAGEPAVAATHGCKNMAECKAKVAKHHHHRHHAEKAMKAEGDAAKDGNDVKDKDAATPAKEEGDAAK